MFQKKLVHFLNVHFLLVFNYLYVNIYCMWVISLIKFRHKLFSHIVYVTLINHNETEMIYGQYKKLRIIR